MIRKHGVEYLPVRLIKVKKLFGEFDYVLNFADDEGFSILAAPNGYGKSTLLKIIRAFVDFNPFFFVGLDFQEIQVVMEDVYSDECRPVKITKKGLKKNEELFKLVIGRKSFVFHQETIEMFKRAYDKEEEVQSLHGAPVSREKASNWNQGLVERFYDNPNPSKLESGRDVEWIRDLRAGLLELPSGDYFGLSVPYIFVSANRFVTSLETKNPGHASIKSSINSIETERKMLLQRLARRAYHREPGLAKKMFSPPSFRDEETLKSLIKSHTNRFKGMLDRASRYKIFEGREFRMDSSVARRFTIPQLPKGADKTMMAIYEAYMDGLLEKYSPVSDYIDRIELLQQTLTEMLRYERVVVTPTKMEFYRKMQDENPVPNEKLSSGEQQVIVILTTLLFGTVDDLDQEYRLVILDEPEISLHPAWQKALARFCWKVRETFGKQFIFATHSPAFIDGCWDKVTELSRL